MRTILWVAGCNHHCPECHNPDTWGPNVGKLFTNNTLEELVSYLEKPFIEGLTLTGGDPLFPDNRNEILNIVREVKTRLPNKTIWLWTGYLWENIKNLELVKYLDVVIDGPFLIAEKDLRLPYAGSRNQRVIDVQRSLQENKVILK